MNPLAQHQILLSIFTIDTTVVLICMILNPQSARWLVARSSDLLSNKVDDVRLWLVARTSLTDFVVRRRGGYTIRGG